MIVELLILAISVMLFVGVFLLLRGALPLGGPANAWAVSRKTLVCTRCGRRAAVPVPGSDNQYRCRRCQQTFAAWQHGVA